MLSQYISLYLFILRTGSGIIQDCDDDGETAAGGRLLHLADILQVTNVLVVVSRLIYMLFFFFLVLRFLQTNIYNTKQLYTFIMFFFITVRRLLI